MTFRKVLVPLAAATTAFSLVSPGGAAVINGTKGADVLRGTSKADVIRGKAGDDTIRGRKGADLLYGQKGDDTLVGGLGADHLFGGPGDDLIQARDGVTDVISCGSGNDVVVADSRDKVAKDCEEGGEAPAKAPQPTEPGTGNGPAPDPGTPPPFPPDPTLPPLPDPIPPLPPLPDPGPPLPDPGMPLPPDPGTPPPPQDATAPLDVSISGTGKVASVPTGIACPTDCSEQFAAGTMVTLVAQGVNGSTFVRWGGACDGTATRCIVSMVAAKSVTAAFSGGLPPRPPRPPVPPLEPQPTLPVSTYRLDVSVLGGGSVSSTPAGIDRCAPGSAASACYETFAKGTVVTLTATSAFNYRFAGWSGACTGFARTCTVTMGKNTAVTAKFVRVLLPPVAP